jgi:galactokinase
MDKEIHKKLAAMASSHGLDITNGQVRRSSSRFCLGVEHGDYNGCELFGVGTDRFIWLAFKPNNLRRVRIFSGNFPEDGVIEFKLGEEPIAGTVADSWSRFPLGVSSILQREGYVLAQGFDAVLFGNIPGGGMSRSASLCLNLVETFFEVNGIAVTDGMQVVNLAQMVENDYIGSPCGKLDQVMIYFAKVGMGTYYNPRTNVLKHYPFGGDAEKFRIVSLDTGTKRPGLEKSTYKQRRQECEHLVEILAKPFGITELSDILSESLYLRICDYLVKLGAFELIGRIKYIYEAQQRFADTLEAWQLGDIQRVGRNFRADGIGLRDDYRISGRELETMCDIARTVVGVYGERMLGGGDKGASGALIATESFDQLRQCIMQAYPLAHPDYAMDYAVHACRTVDGLICLPLTV